MQRGICLPAWAGPWSCSPFLTGAAGGQHEHPSSEVGCQRDRLGGSWELLCPHPGTFISSTGFFKPHRSPCSYRLRGTGCRRLSTGLALLQDDDSRDRVSPVLGAAASVQGAEALVGCVHRLSLRRHADDRCVWVHVTGKSNGTEARRVLSGVLKEHHKRGRSSEGWCHVLFYLLGSP